MFKIFLILYFFNMFLFFQDWMPVVNGKNFAFQALAQYQQSIVAKEAKEIGEELSRLQVLFVYKYKPILFVSFLERQPIDATSATTIRKCTRSNLQDRIRGFTKSPRIGQERQRFYLPRTYSGHQATNRHFEGAFGESVTGRVADVTTFQRLVIFSSVYFLTVLIIFISDLFERLVPVAVHQALARYDARRGDIVNMEVGRLREHTQLMNA